MFHDDDKITGKCCGDCAMMIANKDDSGIDDSWDRKSYLMTIINYYVFLEDEEQDFSTQQCDVCLTTLAGNRFNVSMWEVSNV